MNTTVSECNAHMSAPIVKMMDQNRAIFEKTWRTSHEETLQFINRRLKKNTEAMEALKNCQDLAGIAAVESEWLAGSFRDYVDQTQKLAKLLVEASGGPVDVVDRPSTGTVSGKTRTSRAAA